MYKYLTLFKRPGLGALTLMLSAGFFAPSAFAAGYAAAPNIGAGIFLAAPNPAAPPPGTNLSSCSLAQHPYPVVLIPGTFANMEDDYGALAPDLANAGYCVYSLNYGGPSSNSFIQSVGPAPASAQQVAAFVMQVLTRTGASKVDLIGHSQGGMLAEYYAKVLGGAPYIHNLIALSPTTHGTTLDGFATLARVFPGANQLVGTGCQACVDQESGSNVIQTLDNGPIAQPGVNYTIIETRDEFVVTPVGSSFIDEPGVTNEYVQSYCGFDYVDHADLSYDNVVIRLVKNALDSTTARSPNCFVEFPAPAY